MQFSLYETFDIIIQKKKYYIQNNWDKTPQVN